MGLINLMIVAAQSIQPGDLPGADHPAADLKDVLSIVFGIVGALALLMIVVSGLRYITSAGDPQKAATARSGVIYALIGLLIAIAAQAIVVFIIKDL